MTKDEAIAAIYKGGFVTCTREQYVLALRRSIQEQASKWLDSNDGVRAMIALQEVKRLDVKFNFNVNI